MTAHLIISWIAWTFLCYLSKFTVMKATWGWKSLSYTSRIQSIMEESKSRNQKRVHGGMLLPELLLLLFQPAFLCKLNLPAQEWHYLQWAANINQGRLASMPIWWKDFLNWGSFLPDDPNMLNQFFKKKNSTPFIHFCQFQRRKKESYPNPNSL